MLASCTWRSKAQPQLRAVERGSGWVRPSDDATYHLGMISEDEKVEIARKHLIPHAIAKHGLKDGNGRSAMRRCCC